MNRWTDDNYPHRIRTRLTLNRSSVTQLVTKQASFTKATQFQTPLPVNNDRCLHALLAYLFPCGVVPQSIVGPADEGRLLIKAGPEGGQGPGRGQQESRPQRVPQRFRQRGFTCGGTRQRGDTTNLE